MYDLNYLYKLIIFFLFLCLFILGFQSAKSFWINSAQANGFHFEVADFVAPPTPQLISPHNELVTNNPQPQLTWQTVSDYQNQNSIVYHLQLCADQTCHQPISTQLGLNQNYFQLAQLAEQKYFWQVQACDTVGNCSPWSQPYNFQIDLTAPNVELWSDIFQIREEISPTQQNFSLSLDSTSNSPSTQTLNIANNPPLKSLSFSYLLTGDQFLPGFNQTALTVTINDQLAFYQSLDSISSEKTVYLNLAQFKNDSQLEIEFGLNPDRLLNNNLHLDITHLSSNLLLTNQANNFELKTSDNLDLAVNTEYQLQTNQIEFWASDQAGNTSLQQHSQFIVDDQSPTLPQIISLTPEINNQYTLLFEPSQDNLLIQNYNPHPSWQIVNDPYLDLKLPTPLNDQPGLFLLTPLENNPREFSLTSCDAADNCSHSPTISL